MSKFFQYVAHEKTIICSNLFALGSVKKFLEILQVCYFEGNTLTQFKVTVQIIWKPANWFSVQINWMVSMLEKHLMWKRSINSFQPSVALHIETSHLVCPANQMTGFYMKCNTGLKWVKMISCQLLTRMIPQHFWFTLKKFSSI